MLCENTQFGPVIMNKNEARGVLIWMTWEDFDTYISISDNRYIPWCNGKKEFSTAIWSLESVQSGELQ